MPCCGPFSSPIPDGGHSACQPPHRRVTGHGIAANMRRYYPARLSYGIVGLLLVPNTINIAADIGAMAAALKLLIGGPIRVYAVGFASFLCSCRPLCPFGCTPSSSKRSRWHSLPTSRPCSPCTCPGPTCFGDSLPRFL